MLNNDEFPYTKYFFDEHQILALMKRIFANGLEDLSEDAIASGISSYKGYLEVHFRSDLKKSFDTTIKNNDLFFMFLLDEIDHKNMFYKEMLSTDISLPFRLLFENLIRMNCDFVNYIVSNFKRLVPYIKNNENDILEIVAKHSDENIWKGVFRSGETFVKFKEYIKKFIVEPYIDYSFLFQQMKDLKYIENMPHLVFAKWLKENGFINNNIFDKIDKEECFYSLKKSTSTQRLNNFKLVFGL